LDISSVKNKGSTFSCIFPKARIIDPLAVDSDDELEEQA
jgi:hypothetical protein